MSKLAPRNRPAFARRLGVGLAGAALILAVPGSAVGVSLISQGEGGNSAAGFVAFTPASADPRVARIVAERSDGATPFLRFTPAGAGDAASRQVTVAVRIDQQTARAISARVAAEPASEERVASAQGPRIAPTRYNLGLARGYQSFAKAVPNTAPIATPLSDAKIPDLAEFEPSAGVREQPSRFAARVQVEEEGALARQASPLVRRSGQRIGDQSVDVAGSYRLTRNLDVTAGVRYSQDRALAPLPDVEEQDSQAIYIGTQFRF